MIQNSLKNGSEKNLRKFHAVPLNLWYMILIHKFNEMGRNHIKQKNMTKQTKIKPYKIYVTPLLIYSLETRADNKTIM